MSEEGTITKVVTETCTTAAEDQVPLILHLRGPNTQDRPHVTWAAGTIDNEHLNRYKSNCCCIWVKPRVWNDPSTWEQDECEVEHCRGHTLQGQPQEKSKP
ncbi:unnamed protein product [Thelazia callipaeda]|uniref:E3 ubiquitin-protein ligase PPP1R11 n=1 Tax=Thelazia callipaeda TaxID=103827 RepID=A0A0N5D998_THECL|nr:unnamed protein product [Thelazia callipaeda]